MRAALLLAGAVAVAIAAVVGTLAWVGDGRAARYADVDKMVATVGSTPDLQVALGVYAPGDPVADFSAVFDVSSTHPARPINDSATAVNSEFFLFLEHQPLVEEIAAGGSRYVKMDLSLLRPALRMRAEQRELSTLQGRLGDRWLVFPQGDPLGTLVSSGAATIRSLEQAVRAHSTLGVTGHLGAAGVTLSGSVVSLGGGLHSVLGRLASVSAALRPLAPALAGDYKLTFLCDRSGLLRQVDLGLSGLGHSGIGILINHGPIPISAPSGAVRPPHAAWQELLGLLRRLVPGPFVSN